jgi:AhpD family alkylhydroperoxidase
MKARMNYPEVAPGAVKALYGLGSYIYQSGLERSLLHLVYLRVSQINGCSYCVDMHTKDALAEGDDPQRLWMVVAWREAPFFSERERAAFAWAEAVTKLEGGVSDDVYEQARDCFSEEELANLTLAVVAINGWNRLNVAFRMVGGSYQPGRHAAVAAK